MRWCAWRARTAATSSSGVCSAAWTSSAPASPRTRSAGCATRSASWRRAMSSLLRSALALDHDAGIDLPRAREVARQPRTPGKRVAVVGAGFGGLAAAIRLQAAGMSTTLYEARDKAGGCAYVYEQDGFVFDGGPTVITAPTCLAELFELAGRRMNDYVELLPVHPMYQLRWEDGTIIDYDVMND